MSTSPRNTLPASSPGLLDKQARDAALANASIPSLIMSLVQITGDRRWLEDPFRPQRDTALFAEKSGGLSEQAQRLVCQAMGVVLDELASGERSIPPIPDHDMLHEMMQVCLGEKIPDTYVPMAMEEMGFSDRSIKWRKEATDRKLDAFHVLIVGAGVSGLAAAVRLKEMAIPFTLVDKNADVGGTWVENDYPESGVDTPNHFYSFSFAPNLRWTSNYSKRAEVWDYLRNIAKEKELYEHMTLGMEAISMQWHEDQQLWEVSLRAADGSVSVVWANVVITAAGQLNRPKPANFPGLDTFPGESWHSAQWRHDVPLEDRDIVIVGTGASAMQFLRSVADKARSVTIFQRSPQWIRPQPDYHETVGEDAFWLLENVPYYYAWYRFGLMWRFGDGLLPSLRKDPSWPHADRSVNARNDRHRQFLTDYLLEQLAGRDDLIEQSLPDYPPYGKRILIDNDWFKTLKRPNVRLVTERVDRVEGSEVITPSGKRFHADVILLATGFEPGKLLAPMDIRGRSGTPLREVWGDDDPRAYLGITVADYPNFFCLFGPNTGLAHGGSLLFMAECQVRYVSACLREMLENNIGAMEVRKKVEDDYTRRVDEEHAELVWTHPGMTNWYRNDKGRVFSPVPWRLVDYWNMTHDPDFSEYVITPVNEKVTASAS